MYITLHKERSFSATIYSVYALLLLLTASVTKAQTDKFPTSARAEQAILRTQKDLVTGLHNKNLTYGSPIFIRIFKIPGKLELWVENKQKQFKLFKTYEICNFSGALGPKIKQGDRQSPEGFYFVTKNQLNPWSRFHLSFNLGYPNAYDRYYGRTGNYLMVHGDCVSIGCYAMTDKYIEEIYSMAVAALKNNQSFFRVHIFPFQLTDRVLVKYKDHRSYDFWLELKKGYDFFNNHGYPPNVEVNNGHYTFTDIRRSLN
ncbi:L,D-transpeptidase family protein [Agarilytica rhodophyticola]|uniref:L,D-transpeptidase family protein n=1 Tax=Agarilytica rhodophyticola TaxID=1737490 RepID=UPI001FEA3F04|nr:murein L,D-transpeptidase family protein [Agarilytica rhodophyticola]